MATASSMIIRALQMIGDKRVGGSLTSDEQTAYLAVLNAMLESWSLERLLVYTIVQESKALTTSDGVYTIGSGGDWNTTRPTKIVDPCFIRDANSVDSFVEIIDARAYGEIVNKTTDGAYPRYLYYDAAFASSLGTIYLWPEPAASLTLYINSWQQLQSFSLISTTMVLPPGYQRAIESNLAIELSAGYIDPPAAVINIARESKAAIRNMNAPTQVMRIDPGVVGANRAGWSIQTG